MSNISEGLSNNEPAGKFEHRAAVIVNLDTIISNVHNIKKKINGKTKLMAVVKADAYGHGAIETAKAAVQNGVDYLGVATEEEGIELRESGITAPILVLGYMPFNQMEASVQNDFDLTVFDLENAVQLSEICSRMNATAKIHIKIDTGMGRIGFLPNQKSILDIVKVSRLPNIEITGIYTHLALSDEPDKTYARSQLAKFTDFIEQLKLRNIHIPLKHVSNSGAIADLREFDLDMVRAGIIIYGLSPSEFIDVNKMNLRPALEWKSYVSFIKEVERGESIGYGRTYYTNKNTIVGTVPLGYADGYSRSLSNKANVLIKGRFAPIIGRICMDQFMVDLTGIPEVCIGDEVVLIGEQSGNIITADELANIQNTINYEVLCQISKRVKRTYVFNSK